MASREIAGHARESLAMPVSHQDKRESQGNEKSLYFQTQKQEKEVMYMKSCILHLECVLATRFLVSLENLFGIN